MATPERIDIRRPPSRIDVLLVDDEVRHRRPPSQITEVALALSLDSHLETVAHTPEPTAVERGLALDGQPLSMVVLVGVVGARDLTRVAVEAAGLGQEFRSGDAVVQAVRRRGEDR